MPMSNGFTPAVAIGVRSPTNWVLSPRGELVAFTTKTDDSTPISVMPAAGGWPARLTPDRLWCGRPSWAPDGRRLAFVAGNVLYTMRSDGTDRRAVIDRGFSLSDPCWSPDSASVAFLSREHGWNQPYIVAFDGGVPTCLSDHPSDCADLQWSPGLHIGKDRPSQPRNVLR